MEEENSIEQVLNNLSMHAIDHHQYRDQLISSFLEIAVGHTVETAKKFLQQTNWNIHEATELFLLYNSHYFSIYDNHDEVATVTSSGDDIWSASNEVSKASDSRLASLFRPPRDILFEGSFEEAKHVSSRKNQWLLVNIQSKIEFASHKLNRDVWSDEAVIRTVESNFMLMQVDDNTTEGKKVCSFYKIDSIVPPVVLLIDPVTGQKMFMWNGEIEAESLVQGLKKFMDAGPQEHIDSLTRNMRLGTKDTCLSSNNIGKVSAPSWGEEFEKEDACLYEYEYEEGDEETNQTDQIVAPSECEFEEGVIMVSPEKEEICLEFPDLTEEPKGDCDRSLVCNICVRFPDGRRKQRKFLKSEPVQLLWSFCYSHMEESKRNVFKLVQAVPGASKTLEYEDAATFDQSGLDNSMISVTWE